MGRDAAGAALARRRRGGRPAGARAAREARRDRGRRRPDRAGGRARLGRAGPAAQPAPGGGGGAQQGALLRAAGLPVPRFAVFPLAGAIAWERFPCVVKPLVLSGSRGVIRADSPAQLRAAVERVAAILRSPDVAQRRDPELGGVLIEDFIP